MIFMKKKPNILFILTDDQGAWAMGCSGNSDIKTPNLDSLARQGIRFDEFYCTSPVCSPARASLVTGTIPSYHGILDWIKNGNLDSWKYPHMKNSPGFDMQDTAIDYLKDQTTYMEVLAANGYQCALSGKWHLGDNVTKKAGFCNWYTIGRGGCSYMHPDICDEGTVSESNQYVTDLITERAIQYLTQFSESEAPFYLSVHYTAPHSPWEEKEHPVKYRKLYENCEFTATPSLPVHPWQIDSCPIGDTEEKRRENLTGYYAAISAMDTGVGQMIQCLKERELIEDTIIIFTSDNGMNMGHHGIWGKGNGTYPPNMYDSSIKVPFLISVPGCVSPGSVCHNMLSQYDVFPTILDLAGCAFTLSPMQPGHSFAQMLEQPDKQDNNRVVVFDEYSKTRMIKKSHYKYIHRYKNGPCELYNLAEDPEETVNLYGQAPYQTLVESMRNEMELWFEKYSIPEKDGRNYNVSGKGQLKLCFEEQAFEQQLSYYHSENP